MRVLQDFEMSFVAGGSEGNLSDYNAQMLGTQGDTNGDGIQEVKVGPPEPWYQPAVDAYNTVAGWFSPSEAGSHDGTSYATYGFVVPLAGPYGAGGSVTFTEDDRTLVSGIIGSAGPVATVGTTPAGTDSSSLLGGGFGVNTYGPGVSGPAGDGESHVNFGTPGVAASYTVDPAQVANDAQATAERIAAEAEYWANRLMGIPTP